MPVSEREDAHGRFVVERGLLPVKRLLGAIVFGTLAGFILHPLASAFVFYAQNATRREFMDAAPGFLVMLFGFLLFAVPAWLFLFWRAGIVINRKGKTLRSYSHYGLWRRERAVAADDVTGVRVSRLVASMRGRTTVVYPVVVVLKDEKVITVSEESHKRPSQELARRVARRLGVRYQNRVVG
jgi:hypothetical protein